MSTKTLFLSLFGFGGTKVGGLSHWRFEADNEDRMGI